MTTDIIIPIYNAYEDLQICLESLYRNTDLETNRLILINDNSPDERIKPFLDKQKAKNIIVIHNETNKGFSNNINIGMSQSEENDVILLNSDTVITRDWIEKIRECAYSSAEIGTVTPVSNNATLCSVPVFCEENKLPEGVTVDKAGEIIESCSLKKYPRISVAHGFCMYVKREVIKKIGNFDAATFGRGYGEENDFCNRAEQAGYIHVMCDNTYIYHSGTKSFVSKEKEAYILAHDRILRERYPVQMHKNDVHVRDNPNKFVGDNVGIYLDLANGKKNILYLLQSDFREGASDNRGGTQLHVHDLVSGLRDEMNVFVAARDREVLNLTVYYGSKEKVFRFYIGSQDEFYKFSDRRLNEIWRNILSAFRIDIIHVHHVISTSFDIFYVAKEYNIPVIYTAHDFYFICPTVKLLDYNDEVCIGKDSPDCSKCLKHRCGIYSQIDFISIWRDKCHEILEQVSAVVVPDDSAAQILGKYYSDIKNKIKVVPHGYGLRKTKSIINETASELKYNIESIIRTGFTYTIRGWACLSDNEGSKDANTLIKISNSEGKVIECPVMPRSRGDVIPGLLYNNVGFECIVPVQLLNGKELKLQIIIKKGDKAVYANSVFTTPELAKGNTAKLNIAFIGGFNKAKGGDEIAEIIESYKGDVNWYVFGTIGVESLAKLNCDNLVKAGSYSGESIAELLRIHGIDAVGILSIWPETYSYTLSEALMAGIPVIVSDIGALGRRTKEGGYGWTVRYDNASKDFIELLQDFSTGSTEYAEKKRSAENAVIPDVEQMCKVYSIDLYSRQDCRKNTYEEPDYEVILKAYNGVGALSGRSDVHVVYNDDAGRELEHIKSTKGYKIMQKMWKCRIPGKKGLEKIAEKLLGKSEK